MAIWEPTARASASQMLSKLFPGPDINNEAIPSEPKLLPGELDQTQGQVAAPPKPPAKTRTQKQQQIQRLPKAGKRRQTDPLPKAGKQRDPANRRKRSETWPYQVEFLA